MLRDEKTGLEGIIEIEFQGELSAEQSYISKII
jgi:hypothetical protein